MANSHVDFQDQSVESIVVNRVVMDKYEKIKAEHAL